jgi:murein DD-endopeptidase MepM/ murein hydrolase activator NlpD
MTATPQVEVQTQTAPKTEQTPAKAEAESEAPAAAKSEAVAQPQSATQTPAQTTEQAKVAEQPKSEVQSTAKAAEQPKAAEPTKHNDHLPKANTAAVTANNSIKPVKTVDRGNVIDTLATANKNLAVVLFNDNTWMYIQTGNTNADKNKVFSSHWSDVYTNPYFNVPLSSLPESTPIQLVDSLRAYHYPYKGYVTSRYGPRNGRRHAGMDISLRTGDTIRAVFNGKVRYSRYHENGYGELIIVRHDNGLETYHGHLSKRLVEAGERVVAGQPIALGGNSGRSTGPHLHFECRYMGQSFDPERIINFSTGNLRREHLLLKRSYFSIYSKYEQDFNAEEESYAAEKRENEAAAERRYYRVRSGDYLGRIAKRNHTTVSAICRLNGIKPNTVLKIGRVLRVK